MISDVKFNLYMKEVCKEVGLTQKVMGSKKNPETNRKEKIIIPNTNLCLPILAEDHLQPIFMEVPNKL